jgi:RNA polymerase sigma-70 factor (ECF subfamily)
MPLSREVTTLPHVTDEALFERVRGGDMPAFDELYKRYARRLLRYTARYLGAGPDAEEVFHDAFMATLKSPDVDFSEGSFGGWLFRIARNRCLNRIRGDARARRTLASVPPPPPVEAADVTFERQATSSALDAAIDKLPAAMRELWDLRSAGLTYEEMATALAVPVGTVKSRAHALVVRLRKDMAPWATKIVK